MVAPDRLSVTGITADSKEYDGTTQAMVDVADAMLVGVQPGDNITLNTGSAIGEFASKTVGTGKLVTVNGLTISGADVSNYFLSAPVTTADITAATLNVTGIRAENKPYDGTTTATLSTGNAALMGVISGDAVGLNTSLAVGTFESPAIGNNITVTISGLTLTGADAGNYDLVQPTTTADITAGILTVTGITVSNKMYDTTTAAMLNTSDASLGGVAPGDTVTLNVSGATGAFATADAGNGINVNVSGLSISGADASKYVLVEPTLTANITPAPVQVTGIVAVSREYNGMTSAPLDTAGAMLEGVLSPDTVTLNTSGANGTFASQNVGLSISVTVSGLMLAGADAGNYSLTEPTLSADILPADLMATGITAASKVYDGRLEANINTSGATLMGVIAGDTVTLNTSGAVGTFASGNVGMAIDVDVTGLTIGGASAANYTLVPTTTTANITPAPVEVTGITADDKSYDGKTGATLVTSGATLMGVLSPDMVTLDTSAAMGTFASKDVGTGITVTISGLSLTGAQANNYMLVGPTTTTANITPAMLTVSGITADDKPYDGTTAATLNTGEAMLVGLASGDNTVILNVAGAVGTFASAGPGTDITVNITGLLISGTDSNDYTLVQPMTTATITG